MNPIMIRIYAAVIISGIFIFQHVLYISQKQKNQILVTQIDTLQRQSILIQKQAKLASEKASLQVKENQHRINAMQRMPLTTNCNDAIYFGIQQAKAMKTNV